MTYLDSSRLGLQNSNLFITFTVQCLGQQFSIPYHVKNPSKHWYLNARSCYQEFECGISIIISTSTSEVRVGVDKVNNKA